MTTDAEDKTQSKFPRSSLRARNKTLMITPADVGDFQVTTKKKANRDSDFADGFDDPLSALDDTSADTQESIFAEPLAASSGESDTGQGMDSFSPSGLFEESLNDSLEALSDVLGSSTEEEQNDHVPGESEDFTTDDREKVVSDVIITDSSEGGESGLLDADDIFAAPGGVSVLTEELFSSAVPAPKGDPIRRGTRPVQSVLGSLGAANSSRIEYENKQDFHVGGGMPGGEVRRSILSKPESVQVANSEEAREYVDWKKPGKLIGFLVSFGSDSMGRYVELREGRLLVTSGESSSDSCLVILDESVSPMHAIMRISSDGAILILDQLSEHGTRIRRADADTVESLMGDKSTLCHGDVVIFGECEYHVVVMGAAALKRRDGSND